MYSYTTNREYRPEYHNCLVIVTSLAIDCDVISGTKAERVRRERYVKIVVLSSFMYSLCHVRNRMIYVLSWRTISVLTRVLFCYLFPPLLRNSGNKHQNNPLVSAQTVRHSSTYIIFYISYWTPLWRHSTVFTPSTHWGRVTYEWFNKLRHFR